MESSRLEGKVLLPLAGQPLILWLLSRLARLLYPVVVATPDTPANAALADLCARHGYGCKLIPGDPDDVLGRFAKIALMYPEAQHIVRVGGDTPLLDPAVIDGLVAHHLSNTSHDYTGLAAEWGDGQDCEIFTRDALFAAHANATEPHEREHVSPYIFSCPMTFRITYYPCPSDLSHLRCSVDTKHDLLHVQMILERCLSKYGLDFGWREIWWTVEDSDMLRDYMAKRPMNGAYLAQVGKSGETWKDVRYGQQT